MKKYLTKAFAGVAVVTAALLAAPAAAQAAPGYPDANDITISQQTGVAPGGRVVITLSNLLPNRPIVFTLSGYQAGMGGINLATALTAAGDTTSSTFTTSATGTISTAVTLPETAQCDYTVSAVHNGQTLGPWTISSSVCEQGKGGLVNTGSDSTVLWVSIAGGAVALLGGATLVAASVRKQRKLAE